MTTPPLPPVPVLQCRLDYASSVEKMGSRFYLQYAGTPPTGAQCVTVANGIEAAWLARMQHDFASDIALKEVDVIDISSYSGASGQWTGSTAGGATPPSAPWQCSINCEFLIARRYRGGKPRMFWPAGLAADQADGSHWTTGYAAQVQADTVLFFSDILAISGAGITITHHINLGRYQGFTNVAVPGKRTKVEPNYLTPPNVDIVQGYSVKTVIGSQRRRRVASTY